MSNENMDQQIDTEEESRSTTDWRRFLQAGIGAAGLSGLAGIAAAQSDATVIELEAVNVQAGGGRGRGEYVWEDGDVQGPPDNICNYEDGNHVWVGVSPSEIDGQTNPTLDLTAGESYTVEWTNTTGDAHNFVIVDDNGDELVSSEEVSEEGGTQSVEFTATDEMAEYYCAPHSGSQRGEIAVGASGPFELSAMDPTEMTVERGDSASISVTVTNTSGESATDSIAMYMDGEERGSHEATLDAGEEMTMTFEMDTTDMSDGEHMLMISSGSSQVSGSLIVEGGDVDWNRDLDVPINEEEATNWDNYEVTNVLSTGTLSSEYDLEDGEEGEWMQMDVDPQGRVWVITRGASFVTEGDGYAEIAWVDPDSGDHQLALELPVAFHGGHIAEPHYAGSTGPARELGGQGIAIDPNFEENGYVYIMYHPSSDNLEEVENPYHDEIFYANTNVSRFTMQDDGTLDPDSEEVVFEVPEQWNTCCHHGCYITFGKDREFYISTGDNSNNVGNPDNRVNYFMGDERQDIVHGRPGPVADAQRSSGNTADKRGKIHRIVLNEDGSYDIPDGNLKDHWEEETGESYSDDEFLPEIYVMGLRNPFTITHDEHTDYLWSAHYGNDGGSLGELGMTGFGDYHLWCEPGNAGYPWYRAYYPYRDYDYETGEVGQPFWPDNLRNDSVNNTGIENIPNVDPALIWHPQSFDDYENATEIHPWLDQPRPGEVTYPELDEGGSADVGVVYRYKDEYSDAALPPYFDGKPFFMNPSNADVVRYLTFNDDGSLDINEFGARDGVSAAYDMKTLPDGRLVIMGMYSGIHLVEYNGPAPGYEPPPEEEQPDRVEPAADGLSGEPPGDATVLWNGDDATLDDWQQPDGSEADWVETADYFEVNPDVSGNIQPNDELGDVHLHLEWRAPEELDGIANGQGPANSGVFMMDTYEFQILQSHDNPTYPSGYAGSFYKASEGGGSAPLALPINPPGEWNSYDMIWRRPRFDDEGNVIRLPQATLLFNGVVVQMHLNIPGPVWFQTLYSFDHDTYGHPRDENGNFLEEVPFTLQNHGGENDTVQFRNVWYRDLPERPVEESEHPDNVPEYSTSGGPWTLPSGDQYQPEQITPGGQGTTGEAPGDADVLIDDAITVGPDGGDWVSDSSYGDAQVHVEYRIPEDVEGEGPLRGNSGVLMMGNYEIQILDTHENPVEADEWAGAYTNQSGPHHDSVRQPGEWQQLDLVWQAPRFSNGELDKPAQVTAFLNGVAVQTRLVVDGSNDGFAVNPYNEHGKMPLRLQEEGSAIDFRNAWIREEEADLVSEEPTEPDPLSAPLGLDLGGTHTSETVTIDGLEFLPTPAQSEQIGNEENRTLTDEEKYWPEQVTIEPNPNESPGATNADRPLNTEQDLGVEPDIEGTDYDSMYWTEQWGADELNYTFDIENGLYEVTLHFAEVWFVGEDTRVFSGSINGETVFEELDLYADHGPDNAVTFSHVVEVEDNELVVSLESSVENPKISGIEIREVDLVGHYDASTLALEDGNAVSDWPDAGGVGPDLTQDDSGAQPTFRQDVANGNPTVRFEGDSDFINADEVVTDATAGITMAAAFRTSDPTVPRQTVLFNGSDGDGNGYGIYVNNEEGVEPASEGYIHTLYGGVNWWWSDTTASQDQFHVVTLTIPEDAPDQPVLRLDGQELETDLQLDPSSPSSPTTQFGIGYDDGVVDERPPYFAGDIGEVRVYNRELSASERSGLEAELGNKWGADVSGPDLSTGLAGHWSFETDNVDGDTVLDKSGNGNDGSIQGGVTTDVEAPTTGGAAEFNGDDGTVVVPDADSLDPAEYTVSVWLQTEGAGFYAAPLGKGESMWCGFGPDGMFPRFDPYNGAVDGDYFISDTDVSDGEWHHVVYRHAPSEDVSSIYIDGELAASQNGAIESPASGNDLGIASKSGGGDWFSGALADVRLYNRPLSNSEIASLYEESGDPGDSNGSIPEEAIEPGTAIELSGQLSGWDGLAPSTIEGEMNPTIDLAEGETYQLGWTTGDSMGHNIEIRDGDGNVVDDLETEVVSDPGDGQWLEFEASSEMATYVCDPHESQMSGDINIL